MKLDVYTIIATSINFKKIKPHISKEFNSFHSYCGKELGFNFDVLEENYTKEEINKLNNVCKICLIKFNK